MAQESGENPTPVVISLTPPGTPTPGNGLLPDRFEPNNEAETATEIGFQSEGGLTLIGDDVDAFRGYLKAGQLLQVSTTVHDQLDTRLRVYWEGAPVAENDDRGPADVSSSVIFMAPGDGWYVVMVTKATQFDGVYDLQTALVAPTATPTPMPTLTPSPTPTWMPFSTPTLQPDVAEPYSRPPASGAPPRPVVVPYVMASATITTTATPTATERLSLTVRHVGRVTPQSEAPPTTIRLLVYYDANNDRAPGPGEGIPNVSVLAVDVQGQRLARVFSNAQGEAIFNLRDQAVDRVIVPFVPAWSAKVRVGQANEGIVLGLPAVRLPVFFPVARDPASDG
jgi:hypothetical protein